MSYPLRFDRERAVCERCHEPPKDQSHPVEIVPRIPVPQGWPLNAEGYMMCSTCHDPHLAVRASGRGGSSHLLRGGLSRVRLCAACHRGVSRNDSRSWHIFSTQSAHETKPGAGLTRSAGRLDALSARCLSCHDGTVGSDAGFRIGRRKTVNLSKSHPVGVRYPASGLERRRGRYASKYKPLARLDKRIRLFDGQVGCGSCHNPYSKNKWFLVIPVDRSALCRACHEI